MDASICKIRAGGKLLASRLPTNSSGWRIPSTWLKNGTKFNLVCSSSGINYSRSFTITVR
jgi:hypothetical protein